MPFVNNKKYACESCIKGHRSSNCHHTDRPLFEVKKKGRPVSQCTNCRELRKTRKLHSKCNCTSADNAQEERTLLAPASSRGKPRYMPIAPALPNGLKDVMQGSWPAGSLSADSRQRVDALLNPCCCGDVRGCRCNVSQSSTSATPASTSSTVFLARASSPSSGLNALAAAAAALSRQISKSPSHQLPSISTCQSPTSHQSPTSPTQQSMEPSKHASSRPPSPKHKRAKVAQPGSCCAHKRASKDHSTSPGPTLPPLLLDGRSPLDAPSPSPFEGSSLLAPSTATPYPFPDLPQFTLPHFTTLTSLAGSGCTCGVDCTCPGCSEHRGAEHVTHTHADCKEGNCIHCVDGDMAGRAGALENDAFGFGGSSMFGRDGPLGFGSNDSAGLFGNAAATNDALAKFFAQAALLPLPPNRSGQRVELPKLECCGGNCGCPDGRCGCGQTCDGCEEHALLGQGHEKAHVDGKEKGPGNDQEEVRGPAREPTEQAEKELTPSTLAADVAPPSPRSCCAGKNAL
ncbi:hypothetical protein GGF50DRAFT_98342 [Schizophyllum commune]